MPVEPHWVPVDAVIRFNEREVRLTGEPHALVRPELLESALARPRQHFYYGDAADMLTLALALLFGIARNHPFEQGNKRTAFIAAVAFLEANGYRITTGDDSPILGEFIVKVIDGTLAEDKFREILEPFVEPS